VDHWVTCVGFAIVVHTQGHYLKPQCLMLGGALQCLNARTEKIGAGQRLPINEQMPADTWLPGNTLLRRKILARNFTTHCTEEMYL